MASLNREQDPNGELPRRSAGVIARWSGKDEDPRDPKGPPNKRSGAVHHHREPTTVATIRSHGLGAGIAKAKSEIHYRPSGFAPDRLRDAGDGKGFPQRTKGVAFGFCLLKQIR